MNSRFQEERRQPPYYLLTGLLLGLALGFVLTMVILPVQYSNVPPETLNPTDKDRYRLMIAMAFQANQDLGRASARLGLLRDDDIAGQLIQQSRRSQTKSDAQVLLNLAQVIQNPLAQPIVSSQFTNESPANEQESSTSSPTETILPTESIEVSQATAITPQPTRQQSTAIVQNSPTPNFSADLPFQLIENEIICNTSYSESLIQVEVFDSDGEPIPNARITVTWSTGQDTFFTGFYPEISLGYADFTMTAGTIYSVKVGNIGEMVTDLTASECSDDPENTFLGSIYLRFDAP
ncbi:MAG: hypothetical protein CVU40_06720 [Chloroflexi bacterium HGW-Chloroflexi-2]|jgi:hypothetical protein|nr:MAG: hypothetical protein CVU40_06720 [Chloroflexi bacterium HGW-Chloroflexi-2]